MPYTERDARDPYDDIRSIVPSTPGDLTYCVTVLVANFVNHYGMSFDTLSRAEGAISLGMREFFKRVGSEYEDRKRTRNGDLPELANLVIEVNRRS